DVSSLRLSVDTVLLYGFDKNYNPISVTKYNSEHGVIDDSTYVNATESDRTAFGLDSGDVINNSKARKVTKKNNNSFLSDVSSNKRATTPILIYNIWDSQLGLLRSSDSSYHYIYSNVVNSNSRYLDPKSDNNRGGRMSIWNYRGEFNDNGFYIDYVSGLIYISKKYK